MMNRYIDRYIGIFMFFLLTMSPAYSQITLKGPETAQVGKTAKVQIKVERAKDLKVQVFKNGVTTDQGYYAFKELDDTPVLLFVDTEEAVYTVVVSGNDANKTHVASYTLTVGKPVPVPDPVPDPKPTDSTLKTQLKKLYPKNTEPETLQKITEIFQDLKNVNPQIQNYGSFEATLASIAAEKLKGNMKLQTVRDAIAQYLKTKTGIDPRKWDLAVANASCDEIMDALKGLK